MRIALWLVLTALSTHVLLADLTAARAEPNLEKRSRLALENAAKVLVTARDDYQKGENQKVAAAAAEIQESVELAHQSLQSTGKNPRKSPRWFKHAEIQTRDLLRKLDGFQQNMSYTDRPMLDAVKTAVQRVHDEILVGLMEGKSK